MLSNRRYHLACEIGTSVAHSHFVMYLNPRFRGPNFKWTDLYGIAEGFARTSVGMAGDFGRDQVEMENVSAAASKHALDRCFQESDVQHWLPCGDPK